MNGVFVDSSFFLKILEGNKKAKKVLLKLLDLYKLYKNSIVFSEVIFVYLKLETNKSVFELKKNPEIIKSLENIRKVINLLKIAESLPITSEIEDIAFSLMNTYGLLPNDALIAATCKHYGIKKIATFDKDFKKIDFLETIE